MLFLQVLLMTSELIGQFCFKLSWKAQKASEGTSAWSWIPLIRPFKIPWVKRFFWKSERAQESVLTLRSLEWMKCWGATDPCGWELEGVSTPQWPGNLLQDQGHAVGVLPQLLHQVLSAPAHLRPQSAWGWTFQTLKVFSATADDQRAHPGRSASLTTIWSLTWITSSPAKILT